MLAYFLAAEAGLLVVRTCLQRDVERTDIIWRL